VQDGSAEATAAAVHKPRSHVTALVLLAIGLVAGAALALLPGEGGSAAEARLTAADTAVPVPVTPIAPPPETPLAPSREESVDADVNAPDATLSIPLPSPTAATPAPSPGPLEDLVSRVVPAVAFVQAGSSRGTGFFITRDRVITNAHVVGGHTSVKLQVGDVQYDARVGTVSQGTDLAVLYVANPSPTQAVLRMGAVGQARVGEEVIAVGSALGVLSNTVTRGIVSAVRRVGQVTLVQTDAAINPGNSGGPLISRSGLVIGINSLRVAQQTAEGVAFAVAIDHAAQLLSGQRPSDGQTPLNSLTQMLGGRTDSEDDRLRGEQELAKVLEWADRSAGELDSYWSRYSGSCVANARTSGDRPWFALYESGGVTLGTSTGMNCDSWLDTVRSNADRIKSEIERGSEAARQRGVYPGTVRDLRRRHRLHWGGWPS
jgi:S1-C subfamily serine protease